MSRLEEAYKKNFAKMLKENGKKIKLISKVFDGINDGKPCIFYVQGLYSGQSKSILSSLDQEVNQKTKATVKIRKEDLSNACFYLSNGEKISCPEDNLKTFINQVEINGTLFSIDDETESGFRFGKVILLHMACIN